MKLNDLSRPLPLGATLFFAALCMAVAAKKPATEVCPIAELGETARDCPWALVGRELHKSAVAQGDVGARFSKLNREYLSGRFLARFHAEGMKTSYKELWGQSLNIDAEAGGKILDESVTDFLHAGFGAPPRDGNVVHAGVEHTYGYLFSVLRTSHGYKRDRWLGGDLERGFSFPPNARILRPFPTAGDFFSNVTVFAGSIAFRKVTAGTPSGDDRALQAIRSGGGFAGILKKFPFAGLHPTRLEESVKLPDGRSIVIRTDLVPFPGAKGENTAALIYSIHDSARDLPYLVTLFPVGDSMVKSVLSPANLGDSAPIVTRYNAFVRGLTDAKTPVFGTRKILTETSAW